MLILAAVWAASSGLKLQERMSELSNAVFLESPEAIFLLDGGFCVDDLNAEARRWLPDPDHAQGRPLPFAHLKVSDELWTSLVSRLKTEGTVRGTFDPQDARKARVNYRLSGPHDGIYLFGLIAIVKTEAPGLPVEDLSGLSTELVIRALQYQQEALSKEKQALTDALTQIGNRRLFDSEIARMHREHLVDGLLYSVLMIDVDHFKKLNDSKGHLIGDQVLREIGGLLKTVCRPGDIVARVGGEEFAVLLPGIGESDAARIAERIRARIEDMAPCGLCVTASFGVASQEGASIPFNTLLLKADEALYGAKADGRNRVKVSRIDEADAA